MLVELIIVESYWLTKEWIAIAVYLKWMRNSAYYIKIFSYSSIYWFFIFWFIEIHLRIEIFVCHEDFFFWSSYFRLSLSLRFDLIKLFSSFVVTSIWFDQNRIFIFELIDLSTISKIKRFERNHLNWITVKRLDAKSTNWWKIDDTNRLK
jgi:hypothetical protein